MKLRETRGTDGQVMCAPSRSSRKPPGAAKSRHGDLRPTNGQERNGGGSYSGAFRLSLGANLKRARRGRGIFVRILAARSGVSAKVIEAIEAGKAPRSLPVSAVDRLARALHLPVARLLDLDPQREPRQTSARCRTPRKERPR